ncbi:unnamed protein product [Rotaria sp. Silwood1]|nr:unnamed protein product [Rotaria sp. Silwood1]CAF1001083.1 unnamed protein product [Rotaria sp. Silwood1]CAF3386592.1 unnamed protein product [Rotaria sp. Silwood1]CAF3410849.1 unnamed protein product [Rotaria sp. Silwood1]
MVNFFVRYWKTLAITSISIVSSYFFSHYDYSRINNHLLSALTVQAAEFTPTNFPESVLAERPRPRIGRRQLTEDMVNTILYMTLPKHRGSKRFFRNLEDAGLISYAEYLFLWVILTKPSTQFELTYAVFDTDGNQLVDKDEFLLFDNSEQANATLLIHFLIIQNDFFLYSFMGNLQTEVLEIEFSEFSHGFKTMSELSFAEMLLRYADFDHHTKKSILKNVRKLGDKQNANTYEEFKHFSVFLNNLEDFTISMRFHQLSNKPISQGKHFSH